MKKLIIFSLLFLSYSLVNAQVWLTDIDEAKQKAQETHHNIVLVFQGSDWCAPCIKLDREIWSTQEFKDFAKDHFVMLKADFPRKKANQLSKEQTEKNGKLAEMYNKNGYFPLVVLLDETGKVLGETGYKNVSPQEYIDILTSFE